MTMNENYASNGRGTGIAVILSENFIIHDISMRNNTSLGGSVLNILSSNITYYNLDI